MTQITSYIYHTPSGALRLRSRGGYIIECRYTDEEYNPEEAAKRDDAIALAVRWLDAYFAGTTMPVLPPLNCGGTKFQQQVWEATMQIPPGSTASYSEIAARIGKPRGARAVARALAANPIWIMVPCHRVVGSRGELRGYAGGVERKRWLLSLESNRS